MGFRDWLKNNKGATFNGGSTMEVTSAIARSGADVMPVVNAIILYISRQKCSPLEISARLEHMEKAYLADHAICMAFRAARKKTGLPDSTVLPPLPGQRGPSAAAKPPAAPSKTEQRLSLMKLVVPELWPGRKVDVNSYSSLSSLAGQGGVNVYRKGVKGKWDLKVVREIAQGEQLNELFKTIWPALLLVIDLYSEILEEMGDDEFFPPKTERFSDYNPFALDELVDFSALLRNLSFAMWWNDLPSAELKIQGVPLTWNDVRERVTGMLVAIRSRDCRRSFTPSHHWDVLPSSQFRPYASSLVHELNDPNARAALTSVEEQNNVPRVMTILRHIPFTIPFDDRVFLFRQCVKQDKTSTAHADQSASFHPKPVRRHNLSEDGFDHFCSAETMLLKGRIRITFIDQDGHQEQGLDGGGLWKEFIVTLLEESFNPERGLWTKNEQEELYPFPQMFAREARQLKWYKFIGRMLGKALYDNILIDTVFATFFLAKWVGESGSLDSLASLDPYLHRALVALKQWESDDCLDPDTRFDIVDLDMGQPITTELVPNGSNVPVTKENRMKYIELVCKHRLDDQISEQTQAFLAGLRDLIELKWLKIFDASELQLLLSGVDRDVDVDDWMRNTAYEGGFSATDPCIHMFWTTVRALDRNEKRLLLRFVTSCSRPPLLGFGELKPKFTIRCASNDQNRLPTAATCFSTLKLPRYKEQEVMRNKLVQAITANAGFDLS